MEHYKNLGQLGENIAAGYLNNQGYKVYKNVRHGTKQIDLIACKPGQMRIIEVKTVSIGKHCPEFNVSYKKIRHLKSTSLIFNLILAKKYKYIYVDLMAIKIIDKKMANIKHYFNII